MRTVRSGNHVPIDTFGDDEAQLVNGDASAEGRVGKQAETHGVRGQGVMARRPHETERQPVGAADDLFHGIANRASRQSGHVERARREHGVGLDMAAPLLGKLPK